jgi:hypothetical protein
MLSICFHVYIIICILTTLCMYLFRMVLTENSDYFSNSVACSSLQLKYWRLFNIIMRSVFLTTDSFCNVNVHKFHVEHNNMANLIK